MKYLKLAIINFLVFLIFAAVVFGMVEAALRSLQLHTPPEARGDRSKFAIHDDLIGWRPKPNETGLFKGTRVSQNSLGLRDREISYAKESGKKRIIVLGDSFTWGYKVETTDRFTEQMSLFLPSNIEVINMGCSGYGTDQELLFLETEGLKYSPDLIIVNVHWDSDKMNNTASEFYGYQKPLFSVKDGNLVPYKNFPVPKLYKNRLRWWLEFNSHLWQIIRKHKGLSNRVLSFFSFVTRADEFPRFKSPVEAVTLTEQLLSEMQNLATENKAELLVILTPNTLYWSKSPQTIMVDGALERLASKLRENKIWTLELEPVFNDFFARNPGKNVTFRNDRHWNSTGHRVVAEAIIEELQDSELVFAY